MAEAQKRSISRKENFVKHFIGTGLRRNINTKVRPNHEPRMYETQETNSNQKIVTEGSHRGAYFF